MDDGRVTSSVLYYVTILACFLSIVAGRNEDGSCDFDKNMCGYMRSGAGENFKWKINERSYLSVSSEGAESGEISQITTPLISLTEGHCVTFMYRIRTTMTSTEDLSGADDVMTTSTTMIPSSGESGGEITFNLYVLDAGDDANFDQLVWMTSSSSRNHSDEWQTIQISLSPSSYQIMFEAVLESADRTTGLSTSVDVDTVTRTNKICDGKTTRFLRMSRQAVNERQDTKLTCSLYGSGSFLSNRVSLQKAGNPQYITPNSLQSHTDHVFFTFNFNDVDTTMDGNYRCVYQNDDVIAISNPARLDVKIPPVPLEGPKPHDVGPTHVELELRDESFSGDGPIIKKTLIYKPQNKAWNQTHDVDGTFYTLWHLTPDTTYYFSLVLTRTGSGGRGEIGPEVRVTTTCSAPTLRVSNVNLSSPQFDQITLQWKKLEFADINCHSYSYNVNYRINDDSNSGFESISSGKKNLAWVRNLLPYTEYELRIAIVNRAGTLETTSYYLRTQETVPGPIPQDSFEVISTTSSSIDLKWEKPQHENGQLRNYQISYQAVSSFDPTFNVHNENAHIERSFPDRSIVLQMLRPGTKFNISICAETSAGCGPNVSILVTTDIAPPTMPRYPPVVNETHVTDTTVEVLLTPAHSNGAPVTKYYLVVEDITDEDPEDDEGGISKRSVHHPRVRRDVYTTEKVEVMTTPPSVESSSGEDSEESGACKMEEPLDYDSAKKKNSTKFVVAEFSPEDLDKDKKFVVGDGKNVNGFLNVALNPKRKYRIYLRADSEINGQTKSGCLLLYEKNKVPVPITSDKEKIANGGEENSENLVVYGAIGGAVVALMIFLVIFIFVYRAQRKRKTPQKDEVVNPFEVRLMLTDMTNNVSPNNSHLLPTLPHHQSSYMSDVVTYQDPGTMEFSTFHFTEKNGGGEGCGTSSTADGGDEKFAIRVDDFHLHVSQMKSVDGYGFREEFSLFPDGPTASWNIAQTSINKKKNRYGNIMAYDHSRVVLQPSATGTHDSSFTSDYINASYISGYKRPAMYIAAQAPSPETCSDFWAMIWQEKCSVIVMLTNLMEMGKRKCHKYWSDERTPYGSLEVSMTNEEFTSDYVVRTFLLREIGGYDVREVRQFHFAAWPDHGVPSRPTNLLTFVRRVKAYEPPEGPTIVHCSAGSGRTGCYITIDQMLDMAREEEIVDVFNTVRELRTRRVDMVQTEEQYIFIHEAVLEALICGETSVQPDQLGNHYDEIITVDVVSNLAPIQDEFETLNLITPRLADEECSIARLPRNRAYNRFKDVLPADRHLAYLVTPDSSDRNNSYINAVFVDSYSRKNAFLVTQMPLPSTIVDLWRLIFDHQCTSIVMMNHESEHDQTCAIYWPSKGSVTYGPFTVELVGQEDEIDVVTRMFKLENSNANEGPRYLKQFQLTNWPGPQPVPYSRNAVLRVIQLNMKWNNECERNGSPGRTVVHCVAGAGRSGTFVACHNMCEQMSTEYSADVFNNVQRLRNIRPHLVETLEQYRFCYEVGIEFADQ